MSPRAISRSLVRKAIIKAGSGAALARLLGVGRAAVSNWLTGRRVLRASLRARLERYLTE